VWAGPKICPQMKLNTKEVTYQSRSSRHCRNVLLVLAIQAVCCQAAVAAAASTNFMHCAQTGPCDIIVITVYCPFRCVALSAIRIKLSAIGTFSIAQQRPAAQWASMCLPAFNVLQSSSHHSTGHQIHEKTRMKQLQLLQGIILDDVKSWNEKD
jgi:hypothetical protein